MQFQPLSFDIRNNYSTKLTELDHLSSAMQFSNLFLLDHNNDTSIAVMDDSVVIKQYQDVTETYVHSIVSNNYENTISTLLREYDVTYLEIWDEFDGYIKDEHNAEYIYTIKDFIAKSGKLYEQVRRKMHKATEILGDFALSSNNTFQDHDYIDLFDTFTREENRLKTQTSDEKLAFSKCMMFTDALGVQVTTIEKHGDVLGFAVTELVADETVIIHFFKHTHTIDGLGVFLFNIIAEQYRNSATYINFEQDLGFEGLRQFKEQLRPSRMLFPFVKEF